MSARGHEPFPPPRPPSPGAGPPDATDPASNASAQGTPNPDSVELPVFAKLTRAQTALVLGGIMAGLMMGALDNLVVSTVLPTLVKDLHSNSSGQAFVVSAYLITSTVATPLFGKLSDSYSRRNFFILGLVIFIAGSALSGLAQSLPQLIAFRAIQGVGAGAFFPIGLSIIAVLFPPELRARLTGVFSSVFAIAIVVGPFLGTYIVDHTTWRWIFYVNLPVGIAGIALLSSVLGPLRPATRSRFDSVGTLLLSGWVGALMFALVENADNGVAWTDPIVLALLSTTAVLFVAFVLWERRVPDPVVPVRYFSNRVIAASSSVAFLRGAFLFSASTFVSIYVGFVLGGSADTIRDVLYGFVGPLVIGSILGGQLMTRVSYRTLAVTGMALMLVGATRLLLITGSTPTWEFTYGFLPTGGLVLDLIPLGIGVGLTFATTALAVQYAVPPREIGAATSLVQFMSTLGGAIVVSVLTSFQAYRIGALSSQPPFVLYGACQTLGAASAACAPVVTSWVQTFAALYPLAVGALIASFFVSGRLPKSPARSPAADAAGTAQ